MLNLNKNLIVLAVAMLTLVVTLPGTAEASKGYYMLKGSEADVTTQGTVSCDFNSVKPAPVIYSMTPEAVNAGTPSTTVVIKGANLLPCSQAQFNGEDRPTTFVNPTRILMEVFASDLANPGQFLVTVVNPGPGGGYSNALTMTVLGQVVAPVAVGSVQGANTTRVATVKPTVRKTVNTTASTKPATVAKTTNSGTVSGVTTSNNNTVDLSASAANSGSGFMPDTLIEWLILVVLIFFGIKLFRKMTEGPEKPLKHA
jgi:hypothetical protein